MRTERTWTMPVATLLSCMVFGFAACTVPGTDVADDDGTEDHDNVGTVEQEQIIDTACDVSQNHGGSLFETSFPAVLGCACKPGFSRDHANVFNSGNGDCFFTGFTTSDPHDCRVNVTIKNSGGFLNGTCHAQIEERSDPCTHDRCVTGLPLTGTCTSCTAQICAVDPFCCTSAWDGICVNETRTVCNSLVCVNPPCSHSECFSGAALAGSCSPQAMQICAVDSYCCTTAWDSICVGEVASVAGKNCL
jgi:hypothetical protein